jgi:hypothetical protein
MAQGRIKNYVLKQMYFSVNDGNLIVLKYFEVKAVQRGGIET